MKILFSLSALVFIFSQAAVAAPVKKTAATTLDNSSSVFKRSGSYARLVTKLNGGASTLIGPKIPDGCFPQLYAHYSSGKTLFSKALFKASKPITEIQTLSGLKDEKFYHWTSSRSYDVFKKIFHFEEADRDAAHRLSLRENAYESVFEYLRATWDRTQGNATPRTESLWNQQWYIAEDPNSSKKYGERLLEIEFSKETRVLNQYDPAWKAALQELRSKFPKLAKACELEETPDIRGYGCDKSRAPIYFLVAEDSLVDLINYDSCGAAYMGMFFQMISPKNIIRTDFKSP